ncbi:MAG: 2-succinyl-6-hydroxy-2,4-cyclohexadiene-1-carboxylate synthase [Ktedonobacteraceae bacterium]
MTTHVHVNGVLIGVEERGLPDQPPLILLHGFTGSAASWGEHLATLADYGFRVIALDMLGHGQSDAPMDPQRYTIEWCEADILAVLNALEVRKGQAILLGYSMGGRIALYTAFSGFFRALILESASPGLADPLERIQRKSNDEQLAVSIEHDGIEAFVAYWAQLPLFASQQRLPYERQQALNEQRTRNRPLGLANSLRGVGTGIQPALHEKLASLAIPVLLLAGILDTKFCAIAQHMAQTLPNAQVHIVPDAGHAVHLEQPELFDQIVTDFCRKEFFHANRVEHS